MLAMIFSQIGHAGRSDTREKADQPGKPTGRLATTSGVLDPSRPMPTFQQVDRRNDPMAQLYATAHNLASNWRDGNVDPVSADVNTAVVNVQKSATAAADAIREGDQAAYKALRNLDLHPDGRQARSQQAVAEAQAKADDHLATAEANLTILTAFLEQTALPQMVKGEEQTARMDVQMALSGEGDLAAKLKMLAANGGSIGALVSNPEYLGMLLMSKGIDKARADLLITLARQSAIQAAEKSGDPDRETAARLFVKAKRNLNGAIVSARSLRQNVKPR